MSENVVFKGIKNGLLIIMDADSNFEAIIAEMEKKVGPAKTFFEGTSIEIKYRGRKLSKEEEMRIVELMTDECGAQVRGIEEDVSDNTLQHELNLPLKNQVKNYEEGYTKFYRGTVRSGQLLEYKGHIVVIGDVNPGGELIATGNVIVIGTMRGMVHAGAGGNKNAIVVALSLRPTQLRIADLITRFPDSGPEGVPVPEMAYIKDEKIFIEGYLHLKDR